MELIGGGTTFPCLPIPTDINFIVTNQDRYDSLYRFIGWTENIPYIEGGNIISPREDFKLDVTRDYKLIANFLLVEYPQYMLILMSEPEEGGTTTGADLYDTNALVTIEAIPNIESGYRFVNWRTDEGEVISSDNPYSFILSQDTIIIANFSNTYIFSTSVQPDVSAGTITGTSEGIYPYNYEISVTAVANTLAEFIFVHWADDVGNILDTNETLVFLLKSDTNIVAVFNWESIKDLSALTMFKLSPNPASSNLIMSMELLEVADVNIVLLDINGIDIMQISDEISVQGNWNKEVDVSRIASGTYFLRVSIGKDSYIGKVIIQK